MTSKVFTGFIPVTALSKTSDRMWRLDQRPRKIYLAASMHNQIGAMRFALQLIDAGFEVTSRWLRKDFSDKPDKDACWDARVRYDALWGEQDLEDLEAADTLIVLANTESSSGGYHVELGYFHGAGKTNIIVVGERPNVFFYTKHVRFTRNALGLVEWLQSEEHGLVPHWKDQPEIKGMASATAEPMAAESVAADSAAVCTTDLGDYPF